MKDEKRWADVSAVASDLLLFSLLAVSDEMKDVMCQAARLLEQQRVEISRLQETLEAGGPWPQPVTVQEDVGSTRSAATIS